MSKQNDSRKNKQNINFLHEKTSTTISNGNKVVHEEYIIDGEKGLTIKFFHKEGEEVMK